MKNHKGKVPWWGWLIGIVLIPLVPIYFIATSDKLNKKKKIIFIVAYLAVIVVLGILLKKPDVESIVLKNTNLYLDQEEKLDITIKPDDADKEKVKCTSDNDNVTISDFKLKAEKVGTSKIVCTYITTSDEEIKSNSIKVKVTLNEKQLKEQADNKAKEEAERIEKERKEAEEKAAEAEKNKNILSGEEQAFAKDYAKQCVDKILKAPSTADYPGSWLDPYNDWGMSKLNNLVTVASYVDSENSYGAMIRSTFRMQMQINDSTWSVTYFEFDGQVLQGTYQ